MTKKSDAFNIFLKFQKYVERFFNTPIKSVQSDWGGEYRSISTFFTNCGIVHRVSCPHTHQQQGSIERKHRHIFETGLSLFSHAHMHLRYWDDAFQTSYYLINHLLLIIYFSKHLGVPVGPIFGPITLTNFNPALFNVFF
jgi:hypothetical protein